MALKVVEGETPVTDEVIEGCEARLGVRLPSELRNFFKRHNGGRPIPKVFALENGDASSGSVVAWFLAIHDGPYENFEDYFRTFKRKAKRLPEDLIPFARDPFGNLICMKSSGTDEGAVYFWDHEEEDEKPSYANCHRIAPSISAFLDGLFESKPKANG